MARIAVVNVPFYSHVGAATRLTAVLCRQGHEVTAWGPESCRDRIEAAGARFVLHSPQMPGALGSRGSRPATTDDRSQTMRSLFRGFVASLARTIVPTTEVLVDQLTEYDPDLLIHDGQAPWARIAGDHLGIPRIVTHPMFPYRDAQLIRNAADHAVPLADPDDATEPIDACWQTVRRRWGVELGRWEQAIQSSYCKGQRIITFTTEEIVGTERLAKGWNYVGPLLTPITPAPERTSRPLVYVCFGTSFNRRPDQYRAVIDGLADAPVDVLIDLAHVVGADTAFGRSPIRVEHLGPLPANVSVRDVVEPRVALAKASAHITHGGCNSVHESLVAGVPMLCLPQAVDQVPLAGRIAELGAGRIVDATPASVRAGMQWLLDEDAPHRKAGELAEHLDRYDGAGRADAVVTRALRAGAAGRP